MSDTQEKIVRSDSEWREQLEPERYSVMFAEGTEPLGPEPTGQRYCNNGLSLRFDPEGANES